MKKNISSTLEKYICKFFDNDAMENHYNTLSGIPQGSVLSPILYLIHTFNLP